VLGIGVSVGGAHPAQALRCCSPEALPIGSPKAACSGEPREMDLYKSALFTRQDFFPGALATVSTVFWERCAVQSEIECQIFGVCKRFDLGKVTFTSISSPRRTVCVFDSNSCLQQANNAKPRRLEAHQSRPCVKV
jgi:hypothetical protein